MDGRISQMPIAPVSQDADLFETVQGGTNKRVSAAVLRKPVTDRLDALEPRVSAAETDIDDLEALTVNHEGRLVDLESAQTYYVQSKAQGVTLASSLLDGNYVVVDEDESVTPGLTTVRYTVLGGLLTSPVRLEADKIKYDSRTVFDELSIPQSGAPIIPAAATVDLGSTTFNHAIVSGTGTITSFGVAPAGAVKTVKFLGDPTITYNATSLKTPSMTDILVEAEDSLTAVSLGSGNWEIVEYHPRADQIATLSEAILGLETGKLMTPFLTKSVVDATGGSGLVKHLRTPGPIPTDASNFYAPLGPGTYILDLSSMNPTVFENVWGFAPWVPDNSTYNNRRIQDPDGYFTTTIRTSFAVPSKVNLNKRGVDFVSWSRPPSDRPNGTLTATSGITSFDLTFANNTHLASAGASSVVVTYNGTSVNAVTFANTIGAGDKVSVVPNSPVAGQGIVYSVAGANSMTLSTTYVNELGQTGTLSNALATTGQNVANQHLSIAVSISTSEHKFILVYASSGSGVPQSSFTHSLIVASGAPRGAAPAITLGTPVPFTSSGGRTTVVRIIFNEATGHGAAIYNSGAAAVYRQFTVSGTTITLVGVETTISSSSFAGAVHEFGADASGSDVYLIRCGTNELFAIDISIANTVSVGPVLTSTFVPVHKTRRETMFRTIAGGSRNSTQYSPNSTVIFSTTQRITRSGLTLTENTTTYSGTATNFIYNLSTLSFTHLAGPTEVNKVSIDSATGVITTIETIITNDLATSRYVNADDIFINTAEYGGDWYPMQLVPGNPSILLGGGNVLNSPSLRYFSGPPSIYAKGLEIK